MHQNGPYTYIKMVINHYIIIITFAPMTAQIKDVPLVRTRLVTDNVCMLTEILRRNVNAN
jgi:hypothetical protein